MKKKVLALLLSVAFIINGCTMDNQNTVNKNKDSETAKEQKPEPEPEIDISETNPEVVAYREFLIEKADELEDEFYASFLRIDEDDIYELVVCENQDDVHVVNLYTCIDGQVTPLDTEEFSISESDELFHYIDGGNGFYSCQKTSEEDTQITTEFFYKVEDGKVVLIDAFKKAIQESGDEDTYYQHDEQISEDEFDEQMAAYDQLDYDEVDLEYFDRISSSDAADHVGIYKPYPVEVQPCLKPAIYLYPTEDNTEVTVKLDCNGEITKLDPKFNIPNGWRVTADSDGDIRLGDDTYDYLFWEANLNTRYTYKEGFCVPGKDTETFLRDKLSELGLNKNESDEFIEFWVPRMENNKYNVIRFQKEEYTDNAKLTITPKPDTLIRVFMGYYSSDEYVTLPQQRLNTPERNGFTVVEWGGGETRY